MCKKSLSVATNKWSFSKPFFKIGPNIRFFYSTQYSKAVDTGVKQKETRVVCRYTKM